MEKEWSFQQIVLGQLDNHMHRKKTGTYLIQCTKINSNWIKNLNIKAKIIKL